MPRTKGPSTGYREKIIQGASKLIIEKGVANTSLADIALRVGISKGTLYYYYRSKGELVFDISERHMEYVSNKIFNWIDQSGVGLTAREIVRLFFKTIVSSETKGHIHVYLIQEALTDNTSLKRRFVEAYSYWTKLIEDGLERIMPPGRDYSILARMILACVDGLLLQQLLGVEDVHLDEITRYLMSIEAPQREE
ncbi:MAG: TetR/AcrR family transcriptional regulator [Spirochaetaceae bacterium]